MTMKNHVLICILCTSAVALSQCKKTDNYDKLDQSDQDAFTGMRFDFSQALSYNDSLVQCHTDNDTCTHQHLVYCDSIFHHYVTLWGLHHDNYNHNTPHCDHDHSGGKHHHRGKHRHHDYSQGHHEHDHELMDSLLQAHQPYHP